MKKIQKETKKSIRFFNNKEVRAIWDDENDCWWFSATDIVRAINNEPDYTKAGNYWRWLKRKLKQEGIQLVSATHGFRFEAPDGKLRIADVLNSENVAILAKHYPNNRANEFLDWFTYSDNTIDGQSRKKAYQLYESGLLHTLEPGSLKGNGRATRIWLDLIFKRSLKRCVDWSQIDKNEYLAAMRESVVDGTRIKALVKPALTDKIDDREMFMKGIDYSYYYEQND